MPSRAIDLSSPLVASPSGASWRGSIELSTMFCALVLAGFLLTVPQSVHWFVIPVFVCGCVAGVDAVNWLRRRRSLLDPVGVLGVLGLHVFFLAPLLHVGWDYWMPYIVPPDDWRPWLGIMACINLVGILIARASIALIERRPLKPNGRVWVLDEGRLIPLLACGLLASVVLQVLVYSLYGGINGYIESFSSRFVRDEFRGMGFVFMVSEAFPLLAMFGFAVYARKWAHARSWPVIIAALTLFLISKVYFGGLRGSRAAYIWPLFWSVGIIHLWVRPIPRAFVLAGLVNIVVFMFGYGLYKGYGGDLKDMLGSGPIGEVARERKRGLDSTVLGDLGRSDVQAYVLYRLTSPTGRTTDYDYAFGRTYVGAAALLVPGSLWPDRPPPKTKEGTELFYGGGTWNTRHFIATFAYGLAGETMLNFGPLAVPLAFAGFGVAVAVIGRWIGGISADDSRILIAPFLVSLCIFLLIWDSDVILFYAITAGLLPIAFVRLASRVRTRDPSDAATVMAQPDHNVGPIVAIPRRRRWGASQLRREK